MFLIISYLKVKNKQKKCIKNVEALLAQEKAKRTKVRIKEKKTYEIK